MRRIVCLVFVLAFVLGLQPETKAKDLKGRVGIGVDTSYVIATDDDVDSTVYVGGKLNYGITDYLALGVESGYKSSDVETEGIDFGNLTGIPILGDIIFRIPTGEESRFNPYAVLGLGVVVWDFEESSLLEDNNISIKIDPSFAMKFAGGIDFFLTDNVALNFEGGYVWSRSEAKAEVGGQLIDEDDIKTDYWQVGAGIKYYF